jgi:hypothetical protein
MDSNNNFEQANSQINALKEKMKELDIKQLNEINDIESFFGIKGLREDNVETKAMISINFINNELFICIYVLLITLSVNMVRKRKKFAKSLLIHYALILFTNSYLMEM